MMKISLPLVLLGLAGAAMLAHPRPLSADPASGDDDDTPVFSVPSTQSTAHRSTARPSATSKLPPHSPAARALPRKESASDDPAPFAPRAAVRTPLDPSGEDPSVPDGAVRDDAPWMLSTAVTLAHNPPPVGWNRLDVLVTDPATSEPVTGLALHAEVTRGTAHSRAVHPAVMEAGRGHYIFTVDLPARGSWRIRLSANDPDKGSISRTVQISAGSRQRWTPAPDPAPLEGEASSSDAD